MRHARISRIGVAITAIAICLAGHAAAQVPAKIDVTGAWAFEVQTEAGTGKPLVTFKQDGEKLTGHYSSSVLGEAELSGSIKGTAIEFTVAASVQGNAISVTFTGPGLDIIFLGNLSLVMFDSLTDRGRLPSVLYFLQKMIYAYP